VAGNDHQSEQQAQRRMIDRVPSLVGAYLVGGEHGDRTQQRRAGTVDAEARQPAECHREINNDEEKQCEVHAEKPEQPPASAGS
jgi:hypothetical protein